jgi:hypothetical protein
MSVVVEMQRYAHTGTGLTSRVAGSMVQRRGAAVVRYISTAIAAAAAFRNLSGWDGSVLAQPPEHTGMVGRLMIVMMKMLTMMMMTMMMMMTSTMMMMMVVVVVVVVVVVTMM